MRLTYGAASDIGLVRQANEDSYLVEHPVFAVADGMGGHRAGDVASATAVGVIAEGAKGIGADDADALGRVLEQANDAIFAKAQADPSLAGMGTTCTAIIVGGGKGLVGHIGDSRAYLLRDGELRQLTEDHTLVGRMVREGRLSAEEAQYHPQRSVITRALGVDAHITVDLFEVELRDGDRVLLCSDGLSSMVSDAAIEEVLLGDVDAQGAVEKLIAIAREAGGEDNITAVVIDIGGDRRPSAAVHDAERRHAATEGTAQRTRSRWRSPILLALVALFVLAGFVLARAALSNAWFVAANDDGRVAIFSGLPLDVGGLELSEERRVSGIAVEDLPEFKRAEVEEGIKVASLEEAERTVAHLERLAEDPEFKDLEERS